MSPPGAFCGSSVTFESFESLLPNLCGSYANPLHLCSCSVSSQPLQVPCESSLNVPSALCECSCPSSSVIPAWIAKSSKKESNRGGPHRIQFCIVTCACSGGTGRCCSCGSCHRCGSCHLYHLYYRCHRSRLLQLPPLPPLPPLTPLHPLPQLPPLPPPPPRFSRGLATFTLRARPWRS